MHERAGPRETRKNYSLNTMPIAGSMGTTGAGLGAIFMKKTNNMAATAPGVLDNVN